MDELRMIAGGPCRGEDDECGNGDCPTVLVPEGILKEAARVRGWL
ncbi:hypothetical protein ABZX85_35250 [Streptomyces sp. NPDC004539]